MRPRAPHALSQAPDSDYQLFISVTRYVASKTAHLDYCSTDRRGPTLPVAYVYASASASKVGLARNCHARIATWPSAGDVIGGRRAAHAG